MIVRAWIAFIKLTMLAVTVALGGASTAWAQVADWPVGAAATAAAGA